MTHTLAAMLAIASLAAFAGDDGAIAFSNTHRERCHAAVDPKHTPEAEARSGNVHFDATARCGCVPILLPMLPPS
jgi:hypothetical protein